MISEKFVCHYKPFINSL